MLFVQNARPQLSNRGCTPRHAWHLLASLVLDQILWIAVRVFVHDKLAEIRSIWVGPDDRVVACVIAFGVCRARLNARWPLELIHFTGRRAAVQERRPKSDPASALFAIHSDLEIER
jgi:hypothetical protein